MKKKIISGLIIGACSAHWASAQAQPQEMPDDELRAVHGGFAILPGVLNVGPLLNAPFVAVNALGAVSLVSGVNLAAISVATLDNHWGLAGASLVNHLAVSVVSGLSFLGLSGASGVNGPFNASLVSGVSLPLGITGASVLTLPASLNGFGLINAP
jgi:uncharacterized protein YjeT (DUF2065 family)